MKIKKVEAIVKAKKNAILMKTPACQWLGDGTAFYPLYDMPPLTRETLFTLCDIPQDKWEEYSFAEQTDFAGFNLGDVDPTDTEAEKASITIWAGRTEVMPIFVSAGQNAPPRIAYIDAKYLNPLGDLKGQYELFERRNPGFPPCIVAKRGFEIVGVILPMARDVDSSVELVEREIAHLHKRATETRERPSGIGTNQHEENEETKEAPSPREEWAEVVAEEWKEEKADGKEIR